MVSIFWAQRPISPYRMSFWGLFLTTSLAIYCSSIDVWTRRASHKAPTHFDFMALLVMVDFVAFDWQALAQIRTVHSFVGEQKAVQAYSNSLQRTLKLGYQGGCAKGLGMGITYSVLFCCWALLLWYGGVLVRNGEANGGKALSTIFAVIVGGM
jgi:hypothetical protein